jgi:ATP-dependent helicase HrpA
LRSELERCLALRDPELRQDCAQRLTGQIRRSIQLRHQRHERLPQVSYPPGLPITAKKDEIVAAIKANQVIVIAGETGSGKTTQIPRMCLEAGLGVEGKIGCTQPRRVAALSISRRIAAELNVTWGQEVGCKIRFADRSSPTTYIKLMTDGILLAETQGDPDLGEYDAIVIDEAHERSLNIDFLLGHLKLLLARRPELKLIITSATIDTEAFSAAFNNAPVLEVSGRTYPVEVRYAPHDPDAEESGETTYIDAAVAAVEQVLLESNDGDVLIFMPSERDIRETQDDLLGRYANDAEVVPLFGRLTSGEQDRVFAPSARRKLIVATNIAETSLTIPGVRYVIDTGLARVSRYSPRTRTKRLPIEAISQSSANQRAGRSGRVANGVCIRLYSEEDYLARPRFTQPEIQRANLAEVILKMKGWRLGEMETFPFINPPQPQAVHSGYQLLQELDALDEDRNLTDLGRDLARLPVDPSMGRMILQSVREGALDEVLIVAAGLSIQDPRDRPLDKQDAADQAHRQFVDSRSDFLTLLNIWNAYDAKLEGFKTQNQMRRFCRANFVSYSRMREWIDIHAQLEEAVEAMHQGARSRARGVERSSREPHAARPLPTPPTNQPAIDDSAYASVHRSVLAGLLGHVAQRVERNLYRASGNRQIMTWPGSALFDRGPTSKAAVAAQRSRPVERSKPARAGWIVAGEIVETSRLFGRTVAGVDPEWIAELGAHLVKREHGEPRWDRRAGRVLVRERISLFGLIIKEHSIDYGRVNPQDATDVFIRAALASDDVDTPHPFLEHNRRLRQKIEVWRTHSRDHRLPNIDDALFDFYSRHLESVSSVHDLNRLIRERAKGEPHFLCASEADLTGGQPIAWDTTAFPNAVLVADQSAPLEYAYAPGHEHDGITVKLPVALAQRADSAALDLVVPGLRKDQIEFLLKSLPKALRVPLMPIAPKVAELTAALQPESGLDGLRRMVQERYRVAIPPDAWKRESLPDHLRPRIVVTAQDGKVVAAGRDLQALQQGIEKHETPAEQRAWTQAAQQWERYDLNAWTFGEVPEHIEVSKAAGSPLVAFPGLQAEGPHVHLKLFRTRASAEEASKVGFDRLVERSLAKELAWLHKDLRVLERDKALWEGWMAPEDLTALAHANLVRHLIRRPEPLLPLKQAHFETAVAEARRQLPGLAPKLVELVGVILKTRRELLKHRAFAPAPAPAVGRQVVSDLRQLSQTPPTRSAGRVDHLRAELESLLPQDFLKQITFDRLQHWPRYLKALSVRAERAVLNPPKDLEKAKQMQPYLQALRELENRADLAPVSRKLIEEYRCLLEEYKVSVFAQELGTAQPVSPKRLDTQLKAIREAH